MRRMGHVPHQEKDTRRNTKPSTEMSDRKAFHGSRKVSKTNAAYVQKNLLVRSCLSVAY